MKVNAPEKLYFSTTENGTHYYTEGIPFEREYVEMPLLRRRGIGLRIIYYLQINKISRVYVLNNSKTI